jgi:hypothetical protein
MVEATSELFISDLLLVVPHLLIEASSRDRPHDTVIGNADLLLICLDELAGNGPVLTVYRDYGGLGDLPIPGC